MEIAISKLAEKHVQDSLSRLVKVKGISGSQVFKLRALLKTIQDNVKTYNDSAKAIIEEYAERNEKGEVVFYAPGQVKIQQGKFEEANKKIEELNQCKMEIPEIKLSELGSKCELEFEDIMNLDFIVE